MSGRVIHDGYCFTNAVADPDFFHMPHAGAAPLSVATDRSTAPNVRLTEFDLAELLDRC